MILNNIVIGLDKYGKKLECGDICNYKLKIQDGNIIETKGMIVYDEDTFSFAFEQIDDNFPIILMSKVERDSINKIFNARYLSSDIPNVEKWVEIYNSNLLVAHLE